MSQEKDQVFFKNFSIVAAILALLMVVFMVTANVVGDIDYGGDALAAAQVAERTAPLGDVRVEGEAPAEAMVVADATGSDGVATAEGEAPAEAMVVADAADAGSAATVDGKAIYEGTCVACHGSGIPGIPQLGDAAAWAPRIEQGIETLHKHAIGGFQGESGMPMPPRGGNTALSDDEVKAAVDYMVKNSQS